MVRTVHTLSELQTQARKRSLSSTDDDVITCARAVHVKRRKGNEGAAHAAVDPAEEVKDEFQQWLELPLRKPDGSVHPMLARVQRLEGAKTKVQHATVCVQSRSEILQLHGQLTFEHVTFVGAGCLPAWHHCIWTSIADALPRQEQGDCLSSLQATLPQGCCMK